jgi:serine/threonine protein phosphatase PrpC
VSRFPGFLVSTAQSSRSGGEDRFSVIENAAGLVVVMADGAGGMGHGDAAADAFIAAGGEHAKSTRDPFDMRAWTDLFARCDGTVGATGGECTAVIVVVGDLVAGVSVGDSEAWIVRGCDADRLTELQSRARLGSGRARPVMFHRRSLEGVLLVATDGLFKHASRETIVGACADPEPANRLVASARLPTGNHADDTSVIVVRRS